MVERPHVERALGLIRGSPLSADNVLRGAACAFIWMSFTTRGIEPCMPCMRYGTERDERTRRRRDARLVAISLSATRVRQPDASLPRPASPSSEALTMVFDASRTGLHEVVDVSRARGRRRLQ